MILLDLKNMKVGDEILWVGSGVNSEQSNPIVASHHTIVTNKTASEFSINDWKDIKSELVWPYSSGNMNYRNSQSYITSGAMILAKQMKGYKPPKKLRGWVLK